MTSVVLFKFKKIINLLQGYRFLCLRKVYRMDSGDKRESCPVVGTARHCHGGLCLHTRRWQRVHICLRVCREGEGGASNSHFNIFSNSRLADSSHLRYVTCA